MSPLLSNYEEYAVIKSQIEKLKEREEGLKIEIMEEMEKKGEDKAETSVGKFTISKLKTWTYTPKVTELNEEFKARKAHEESAGLATFVEKPSLRFTKVSL